MPIYLAFSPVLGPKEQQFIGPFDDLADANTAKAARWPHLDVVVLPSAPNPQNVQAAEHGCKCGRIKIGSEATESRNWNPDCPTHGTASSWWNSPEQVEKRAADSARLLDLQRQAREARQRARNDRNEP
jgi:hypothetical protein